MMQQKDHYYRKVTFARGMDTPVTHLLIDQDRKRLVYLHLGDVEQKVRSAKAYLFNGGARRPKTLYQADVQIGGADEFELLSRKSSTTEWNELVLINRRAVPKHVSPHQDCIYCVHISDEYSGSDIVPNFYNLISQALKIPIKKEWANHLWDAGKTHSLISNITDRTTIGDVHGYRIYHKSDKWETIIQNGLQNQAIAL